jgi:hypothetical protein
VLGIIVLQQALGGPDIPETGRIEASAQAEIMLGRGQDLAEGEVSVTISEAQPDPGQYRSSVAPGWARPFVVARMTSQGGAAAPAIALADAGPGAAGVSVTDLEPDGSVIWRAACLDPEAGCTVRLRILVARPAGVVGELAGRLEIEGHLEYPVNVPAPGGAKIGVSIGDVAAGIAAPAGSTRSEEVVLVAGAAPAVRAVSLEGARSRDGTATRLLVRVRLDVADDSPPAARSGADAPPVVGSPARLTLVGLADEPIVRDLGRGAAELLIAIDAPCERESCARDVVVALEIIDPRPGAKARVTWVLDALVPGDVAPTVTASTVDATPVVTATSSGTLSLTRAEPEASESISLQLSPAGPRPGGRDLSLAVPVTGTLTFRVSVSGSTRRAPVDLVVRSEVAGSQAAAAALRVSAGAQPEAAVIRPFDGCPEDEACSEHWAISATIPPEIAAVITSGETVVVAWQLEVVVSRFGPSPAPGEPVPDLVIE